MIKNIRKMYGGGSDSSASTTTLPDTQNPDYIYQQKFLKKLAPAMKLANTKMTAQQIIDSLPAIQQQLITSQKTQSAGSPMDSWGMINNYVPHQGQGQIIPQYAPQAPAGLFSGIQGVNPANLQTPNANYVYQASLLGQPQAQGK